MTIQEEQDSCINSMIRSNMNMIKIVIILSLGVATYFVSSSKNDTLKYVVYASAVIGAVSTLLVGHKK